MKKIVSSVMVLSLVVLFGAALSFAAPKIHVTEDSFDFGNVTGAEMLQHNFVIENQGDAQLIIDKTQASCGCTSAMLTYKSITPLASGIMQVSFNPQGKMGPVSKTVTIFSNDPAAPQKTVRIDTVIMSDIYKQQKMSQGFIYLEAEATADGSLSVSSDLMTEATYQLKKGDKKIWEAQKGFVLKIGNAGGLNLTMNGKPFKITGKLGEAIPLLVIDNGVKSMKAPKPPKPAPTATPVRVNTRIQPQPQPRIMTGTANIGPKK